MIKRCEFVLDLAFSHDDPVAGSPADLTAVEHVGMLSKVNMGTELCRLMHVDARIEWLK